MKNVILGLTLMIHLKLRMMFSLWQKEMIGWMVRNFISREANVVLKMYNTLIRPHTEYCT